jgi:phage FluMu protein Com
MRKFRCTKCGALTAEALRQCPKCGSSCFVSVGNEPWAPTEAAVKVPFWQEKTLIRRALFSLLLLVLLVGVLYFYVSPFLTLYGPTTTLPAGRVDAYFPAQVESLSATATTQSTFLLAKGFEGSQFNGEPFPSVSRTYPHARIRCEFSDQPGSGIPWYTTLPFVPFMILLAGGFVLPPILGIGLVPAIWTAVKNKAAASILVVLLLLLVVGGEYGLYEATTGIDATAERKFPLIAESSLMSGIISSESSRGFVIVNASNQRVEVFINDVRAGTIGAGTSQRFTRYQPLSRILAIDAEDGSIVEALELSDPAAFDEGLGIYNIGGEDRLWIENPPTYHLLPGM